MLSVLRMGLVMAVLAAALSGCGKKGPLEAPNSAAMNGEEGESSGPKQKPSNKIAAAPTMTGNDKNNSPRQAPMGEHDPFILDGLLR